MRWWKTREFGVALVFLALGLIAQYVVPQYGIPIALTVAVIGFFIIRNADKREYIEKGGADIRAVPSTISGLEQHRPSPKKYLRGNDWTELQKLSDRLDILRGHDDYGGIRTDRLDGYTWNEIRIMPCHECQIPRDKKSGGCLE